MPRRCGYKGCQNPDVEEHHMAPRNTFPDADLWPRVWLCHMHHDLWHQAMTGYDRRVKRKPEPPEDHPPKYVNRPKGTPH